MEIVPAMSLSYHRRQERTAGREPYARKRLVLLTLVTVVSLVTGCGQAGNTFSGRRAYDDVKTLVSYGPRPVGSEANRRTADYIAKTLRDAGWKVEFQDFTQGGLPIRNVIASKGSGPLILLGTHYDTRPVTDQDPADRSQPVVGANDGASGVAVLLELARVLSAKATDQAEIRLAFFDAEDRGDLNGWDWSIGAQYTARNLDRAPRMVIIVDMVGDADQQIYYEWNSSLSLQERIWRIAAQKGYGAYFIPTYKYAMTDDHTPFIRQGYPTALIIDFDYPAWHTTQDTLDKISADSLQRVGNVLQTLLEGEPFAPNPVDDGPASTVQP
jgi:glutaminyl-peptide cyclotransferase